MTRDLATELDTALGMHPDKAAYDACLAEKRECPALVADVIYLAMFNTDVVRRITQDEVGLGAVVAEHGIPTVVQALGLIVASSEDPLARISALMLMRYYPPISTQGEGMQLPDAAYKDLAQRPIPEARLLAERHRRTAVPATVASELARLAEVDDTRARRAAIIALGHAQTATELHDIVLGLQSGTPHWFDAATAASQCGLACAESLEQLASGPKPARLAAYEALAFAPDGEREQLTRLLVKHVPAQLDEDERAALAEFIPSVLAGMQGEPRR
jgi:hypothetical protein